MKGVNAMTKSLARSYGLRAFALPVCLFMAGCSGVEGDAADVEDVGVVRDSLVNFGGGTWQWPSTTPTDLAADFNTTCFLTAIGGKFEGGGESVSTYPQFGRWSVFGSTGLNTNLNASARCVGFSQTATGSWSKGQPEKFLQNGGACFLSSVVGKFVGGGEQVLVSRKSNGDWVLNGSSGTDQTIGATARCIKGGFSDLGTFTNWAQGTWSKRMVQDGHPDTKVCFLQGVQGGFRGANEQVSTSHGSTANFWYLNGQSTASSSNSTIGATAGCIGD